MAKAFAITDLAKSALGMQCAAGFIGGKDLCLQRPIAFAFGNADELFEQCRADAATVRG